MQLQDINKLLNLQEIKIKEIAQLEKNSIIITAIPIAHTQKCCYCKSDKVIRKGLAGYRRVRHLSLFQYQTWLKLPKIRMLCKKCSGNFSWRYSFVKGKSRSTNLLKKTVFSNTIGSTTTHISRITKMSYSNCERIFKSYLDKLALLINQKTRDISEKTNKLVLGIDDFAIRKGHSYNTGIHDIRNGNLLHIIEGRKLENLRNDREKHPHLYNLNPVAVVMDLAKYYHTFAAEVFPNAIRIADRFHVNQYILNALQEVRRRISKKQSSQNCKFLKQNKVLLSKRQDTLENKEIAILKQMLNISHELKYIYDLKEKLINWYEYSTNINQAKYVFQKWLREAKKLNISELNQALITFENWKNEIINYHLCRFTNASVEGKNNKIKALQRRCYFIKNRKNYLNRIIIDRM